MKINFQDEFLLELNDLVAFISQDKPSTAKKFKIDLLKNLKKDLKHPFLFKKSKYFNSENVRDYVFKGYTIVYQINSIEKNVSVLALIKYKDSL